MTSMYENPHSDPLLGEFWEMCVRRDLEAFLATDWAMTAVDFDAENFLGIHANNSSDPCNWRPVYASLDTYRDEFNQQASDFANKQFAGDPRAAMYQALTLGEPEINGDRATIVKTFDGELELADGSREKLAWKSFFHLKKTDGRWLFTGFVGYLPL